jgi:hypothetical protein
VSLRAAALLLCAVSCSSAPATSADLALLDLAEPAIAAPAGFWAPCMSSPECAGYTQDAPPGVLGCASFAGVDHCTRPCGDAWPSCWSGTTCSCVDRVNAGGLPERDCYCAPAGAAHP